ncbi:uncharacterized protein LOC111633878 [Centruroides sculpturatus]|uniref:uncharacterized protein LOC111617226 n=1 Tax=Centruroides sculpturatus TaxID=218467 RepID=UPI000C6EB95F|nr:uncharacterized protein LOC111617226 [Centruroides sculpturatus]XP_023234286.1 uncharacterized protein LOC111633878 [Centruroides sculpturatus]
MQNQRRRGEDTIENRHISMALDSRINQSFHSDDVKEFSGEKLLLEILTLYYSWKRIHGNISADKNFERLVVYHMAKVCTYWNVKDSSLVAEVLNCIFHSEGHFSMIFNHAGIYSNNALSVGQWLLTPEQHDAYLVEHHTVSFFLYHANKVRMTFCGTRFVDRCIEYPSRLAPCYLAAILVKPQLLLLLLQYGARLVPKYEELRSFLDNFEAADLYIVLLKLISRLRETVDDDIDAALENDNSLKILSCLKFLLRASGQLQKRSIELIIYQADNERNRNFMYKLMDTGILESLRHRYLEPCPLKHLARCTIRNVLNENWQLPHGIPKLPLPLFIQKYLNLLED